MFRQEIGRAGRQNGPTHNSREWKADKYVGLSERSAGKHVGVSEWSAGKYVGVSKWPAGKYVGVSECSAGKYISVSEWSPGTPRCKIVSKTNNVKVFRRYFGRKCTLIDWILDIWGVILGQDVHMGYGTNASPLN